MMLYGTSKTDEDIKKFIIDYVQSVKDSKNDRYHAIMSLIPSGISVMDYGCGWGHFSIAIRDKGNTVTAIDYSQNELDICDLVWGEQESIKFLNKPISHFPDKSFDCVLSNQVIEHVHNVGNYLSEINRVLAIDGILVISLPNIMNLRFFSSMLSDQMEEKLKKISKECLANYDKTHDHINAWDPAHFTRLLASVGFVLETYIPTEGVATPFQFKPYWYTNIRMVKNYSYTMTFSFRKSKDLIINNEA